MLPRFRSPSLRPAAVGLRDLHVRPRSPMTPTCHRFPTPPPPVVEEAPTAGPHAASLDAVARRRERPARRRPASSTPMRPPASSRAARAITTRSRCSRYSEGALYQIYTAPGQITNIALEPGERLTGDGSDRRRRHRALDHRRHGEWERARPNASTSSSSRPGPTSPPTWSSAPTGAPISSNCAPMTKPTCRRSPGPIRKSERQTRPPAVAQPTIPPASQRRYRYGLQGDSAALAAADRLRRRTPRLCRLPARDRPGRDAAALRHRRRRRGADRQHPRPPQHPDRRPAVRRRRTAPWRREPADGPDRADRWMARPRTRDAPYVRRSDHHDR